MDRRDFNKLLAATSAMGMVGSMPARAQGRSIRMIESGGPNGEAVEAAYIKPFSQKTGIKIVRQSPNDLGKLRALVESGDTSVSLYELGALALQQAKAFGLLEKLDWNAIKPLSMFPEAKDDYGMGYQFYSMLMCWRKGAKAPRTWAEFFDSKSFPGKRSIPNNPAYVLPAVLLASGVSMDKLYPLDVELAFTKLRDIRKDVSVWWTAGAQPLQLLRDNEVQYAMSFSGRVVGQEDIGYTYNQASLNISYFCVVKGTSPADTQAAYRLLYEMSVPQNQLVAARMIPYSGNSPDLEALLPKDRIDQFPTTSDNKKIQFLNDNTWWTKNADSIQKRWQEFVLGL
jgi:putative spermidine/putrescine transport system substrate-binding protein